MPFRTPDHVDFELLKTLHILIETRSVTRTAEILGVSQPAVSRALARLRDQFGDSLLMRGLGGMIPTPRAEEIREPLGLWLAQGRDFLQAANTQPSAFRRSVRIASTDFGILSVVAPSMRAIGEAAPQLEMSIEALASDSTRKLASGDLDLVVTGLEPNHDAVHSRWLFKESHMCVARQDHPALVDKAVVDLETFLAWPHVVVNVAEREAAPIERKLPAGATRRILMRTCEFSIAPTVIAASDSFMVLPSMAARSFARTHGLKTFAPPIDLGTFDYWLVWGERSRRDGVLSWLIDQLAAPFQSRQAA